MTGRRAAWKRALAAAFFVRRILAFTSSCVHKWQNWHESPFRQPSAFMAK
eukprot:CAMPEP_0115090502 /NCGR_PEP_ID=MMETSP0227-20121206/25468_1 /TAXON_ID=89957 /ORGANISM="Polarella glacialis, Strain CCMP 1383" /LENGTH=49 /DNA_ID=CAMNT_0002481661 /DNA_START=119 /DNA_END=268 /DNA_ORIENTATION=+